MKNTFFDFKLFALPDAREVAGRSRGDNLRQVLVLVDAAVGEDQELEAFLERMLKAARLDLRTDVSQLRLTPGEALPLSGLQAYIPFSTVLAFGVTPRQLGLHLGIGKYQPFRHAAITYLFADPLPAIYEERQGGGREMAGALWSALQAVFLDQD